MSDEAVHRAAENARAVSAELRTQLAAMRAELDAARAQPILSQEDKEQLQDAARDGRMGDEMREFAEDVRRGRADWESFVRGEDEHASLLAELIRRGEEEDGERLAQAMAESDPPPDVDDPRPPHLRSDRGDIPRH